MADTPIGTQQRVDTPEASSAWGRHRTQQASELNTIKSGWFNSPVRSIIIPQYLINTGVLYCLPDEICSATTHERSYLAKLALAACTHPGIMYDTEHALSDTRETQVKSISKQIASYYQYSSQRGHVVTKDCGTQ